jgi:hypothetical protein
MFDEISWGPVVSQVALGLWLVASGFLWPHSPEQLGFAFVSGALCTLFALGSLLTVRLHYANHLVAIWLLVAVILFPAVNHVTVINHVLAAAAILAFSHLQRLPPRDPHASQRRDS